MRNSRSQMLSYGLLLAVALALAACGSSTTVSPATQTTGPAPALAEASATARPPTPTPPRITEFPTPVPTSPTFMIPTSVPVTPTPLSSPMPLSPPPIALRLAQQSMDFLTRFTEETSPRVSGTERELAAANLLAAEFEALGYVTELQPFSVDLDSSALIFGSDARAVQSFPLTLSAKGEESALLVDVGKAFTGDMPVDGLQGKIALIQRGNITFEEKVTRVADAGALAAVIYNNEPGLFGGTLLDPGSIPTLSISRESGEDILELMAAGDVEATVMVAVPPLESRNVIAEIPGTAGDGSVVVLGGHYDTIPGVAGANDNGSGIATLMSIASEIADTTYPFTVRFIAFGSEEMGLFGSGFYVASLSSEEQESVIAMLNFDALATGDVVGLLGAFDLSRDMVDYGREVGIPAERRPSLGRGLNSDHAAFQRVGIPIVFFLADDISRIHTPDDTLEFVQPELMGNSAALAIFLLDSLREP